MPSKILNFNKNRLITGINIIDGMLFFTDNETEPKKINIEKFKGNDADVPVDHSSGTTQIYNRPFEERDITVIKEHPIKSLQTFTTSIAGYTSSDINDIGDGASYYDSTYSGDNDTISVPKVFNNGVGLNYINNIIINGRILNPKDLREVGFYYTFDPEYATKDAIISQTTNKTFKVTIEENRNDTLIDFEKKLDTSSPGMSSIAVGTEFYFLAYAYDASYPESEIYADEVSEAAFLQDPNAATTISNFRVDAKYIRQSVLSFYNFVAKFDGGERDIIQKEFLISKNYSIIPSTPPTAAEVLTQIIEKNNDESVYSTDDNIFPAVREAEKDIFQTKVGEFSLTEYVNLTAGFTYYVYAKITLDSGEVVYSGSGTTPGVFTVSDGIKSIPAVQHIDVVSYSNKIILKAEVLKLNDPSRQALEAGFLVSKSIKSLQDLKLAFVDGANANGTPVQSGHVDTYKVLSTNQLNADGTGEFEYDTTSNFGTLQSGERIYYVAFVKNQSGATGYGSKFGYTTTGELGEATTIIGGDEPIINLNAVSITRPTLVGDNYDLDFEFELTYMPGNTTPEDIGIVSAMPTGSEIGGGVYSVGSNRLNGFKSIEEIDSGAKKVELVKSDFTFTSNGDSTFLGTYTKEDHDFSDISKADKKIWSNLIPSGTSVYNSIGNSSTPIILGYDPHGTALSTYAYVIYNNKTYYSNIINGAKDSNSLLGFDLGLDDGIPDLNFGAPTIKTSNKENKSVTNTQDTQVTLEGRIADNNGVQGASPISEIGFYYGTTDPNLSQIAQSDDYHKTIEDWVALGTTTKQAITVTSQMQNWHTQDPKLGWLEFDYTLTGQTAGSTIYFVAFVKPTQSTYTGIYSSVINDYNNRTKYGNLVTHTFNPNHTSVQSADEPRVIIKNVEKRTATSSGVDLLFIGEAFEIKDYYNITTKGFYYKAASVVEGTYGANPTAANVKTANGSATDRTTLSKTDFNENDPAYAVENIVGFGEYYVSAFCITTTNGNTETFISNNFKKVNITSANNPVQQDTSPGVSTGGANSTQFPVLLTGTIFKNNVNISEKGFYIIGKKDDSFSKPANGAALKAIYDSPGSGVIINKINNATGGTTFSKTFTAQKRGYTYYFSAYAKNSGGEETIANNVSRFFLAENIAKFIKSSSSFITVEESGEYTNSNGGESYGAGAYVIITTEEGSDTGNWKIARDPVWNNTGVSVNVIKKILGGKPVLYFPPQYPNNITKDRRSAVTIQHAFDPSVSTSVSLRQKGATNVEADTTTEPLRSPGKEKPKNISKEK